ncbi:putative ABC transport system permease protein [Catalinimonas alkaloidigena]|uniref:ABC transporter permease n=1 Tax=Catalinimonas alkaloidigena TaxID=1075417 RepID=UPI002405632A|nr:ABC transporter permease [Catalinimonas alkaloidigena]MDF9797428.1 putative ABC transport system permease protein [Catalinimonas alkaloidigena]
MIKNYIILGFRNLLKQKFYTLLNVLGLSIGVASFMLIVLYVVDEVSYDRFHANSEQIYRVGLQGRISGQEIAVAVTCPPLGQAAQHEFPEVDKYTRLYRLESEVVRYEDIVFTEKSVFFADSSFFDIFDYELLAGDPATVLREPHTIVISASTAIKYFGNESALGKTLNVGDFFSNYEVTGIIRDTPQNAHFHFDMLYSMSTLSFSREESWLSNSFYTYLLLNPEADVDQLEHKMKALVEKYVGPEVQQFMGVSLEEFEQEGGKYGYFLQPLTDIHLHSHLDAEIEPNGNITYLYILSAVALFMIMIACINFMNLATARSANRAKEVGVRKTLGSVKSHLITQFLTESILVSAIATLFAILLISLSIEPFNQIAGKGISFNIMDQAWLFWVFILIILGVGLLAGSYPAFYLSAFRPAEVLKGKIRAGFKSSQIRNGLVVFQFFISIALIVCTILVYKQLEYTRNIHLGFDKENVLVIKNGRRLGDKIQTVRQQFTNIAIVENASVSTHVPPGINNNSVFRLKGSEEDHLLSWYFGDYEHIPTLAIELTEGRNFSRAYPSDTAAVILNQAAVKEFNLENPINSEISFFGDSEGRLLKVIGVMKDFNYQSLKQNIRPMAMLLTQNGAYLSLRLQKGKLSENLLSIEQMWKEQAPGEPFEFTFLDEDFDALFRAEQRLSQVFTIFTAMAIFIACLGLMGLAAFTAEQRTKEIGIRKVMGASVANVCVLLSKDFTKLIGIAFLIAVPVAY